MGFGKDFVQGAISGVGRGAVIGAESAQARLNAKLKEQAEINKEEREAKRNSDKLLSIVESGAYDDFVDRDLFSKTAERIGRAGGTIDDLNKVIESSIVTRQQGREERFQLLNSAVEKQKKAQAEGYSTEFTPEEIRAAEIEGVNLRRGNPIERIMSRIKSSEESRIAEGLSKVRTPGIAAGQELLQIQSNRKEDTEFRNKEFTLREARQEADLEVQDIQRASLELAQRMAELEEIKGKRPSEEDRAIAAASAKELGLGGTGRMSIVKTLLQSASKLGMFTEEAKRTNREITMVDKREFGLIRKLFEELGPEEMVRQIKEDGITERELKGYQAIMGVRDRSKAMKDLSIKEEDIQKIDGGIKFF